MISLSEKLIIGKDYDINKGHFENVWDIIKSFAGEQNTRPLPNMFSCSIAVLIERYMITALGLDPLVLIDIMDEYEKYNFPDRFEKHRFNSGYVMYNTTKLPKESLDDLKNSLNSIECKTMLMLKGFPYFMKSYYYKDNYLIIAAVRADDNTGENIKNIETIIIIKIR